MTPSWWFRCDSEYVSLDCGSVLKCFTELTSWNPTFTLEITCSYAASTLAYGSQLLHQTTRMFWLVKTKRHDAPGFIRNTPGSRRRSHAKCVVLYCDREKWELLIRWLWMKNFCCIARLGVLHDLVSFSQKVRYIDRISSLWTCDWLPWG